MDGFRFRSISGAGSSHLFLCESHKTPCRAAPLRGMCKKEEESIGDKSGLSDTTNVTVTAAVVDGIKIEDVYEALGGYSYFQLAATLIMVLPEIPAAMLALLPVFTGANNAPFYCNGSTEEENWTDIEMEILPGTDPALCFRNCTDRFPAQRVYTSVVQEWDLVCEYNWISDTFTSIQMAGMMTGAFIASQMADFYGRKKVFYLMTLFMGAFGIVSGLVTDIYSFAIAKFLTGIGLGGYYAVYNIYLIEFLTPNWRTIVGCVSIWCFGEMVLALLGYFIPSWRILTIACSLPAVVLILTYPLLPESPRWLLCNGKTEEAIVAFASIAKLNSKPATARETIEGLQGSILKEIQSTPQDGDTVGGTTKFCGDSSAFRIVLENKKLRLRLLLFLFGWFSCAFVYYGISFNTKNLSGDPYMNVLYLGLVDMPAFPSGILFSNWLGRKKTFCLCLLVASTFLVALVATVFIVGLTEYPLLITTLCFCARFGAGGAWGIATCFAAESFPTVVRSTCLGLCCLAANIGGVLAPQLAYIGTMWPTVPYFIFCALMVCNAATSWFLGETNGKPLKNFGH